MNRRAAIVTALAMQALLRFSRDVAIGTEADDGYIRKPFVPSPLPSARRDGTIRAGAAGPLSRLDDPPRSWRS